MLKINQESLAGDDLEPALARIFLRRAEKLAYLQGDDNLDFEYVAQVIAEAHNAGITRVGLLTRTPNRRDRKGIELSLAPGS
jgi:biopolymer transport protein ExbD